MTVGTRTSGTFAMTEPITDTPMQIQKHVDAWETGEPRIIYMNNERSSQSRAEFDTADDSEFSPDVMECDCLLAYDV